MAKNKFSKALKHLKSTELDEKIQSLNESPTNSIGGVYALNQPGFRLSREVDLTPPKKFYPNLDGSWPAGVPGTPGEREYIRPAGYWEEGPGTVPSVQFDEIVELDFSYSTQIDDPRNTKTIIDETTGRVKTDLPPNSRSFILGPLVDLYFHNHSNDNRTYVGYIQKDTREFVLLGSVAGTWGDDDNGDPIRADGFEGSARVWNGQESTFSAHNDNFTFEMLQWHHDRLKEGKYIKNVAFFNSGGVPIISGGGGTGQPSGTTQGNASGTPTGGNAGNNGDANQTHGSGGTPNIGTPQDPANHGGPGEAILWGLIADLVGPLSPIGSAVSVVGDILKLVDQLPAFDYSKDIAMSILTGEPIVHDQSDIPQNQIDALINNIPSNMIGNSIPVTNQEIPYADDNIKTDLNGNVSPNVGPNKVPNTTGPMSYTDPGPFGILNPLHAAGQAQAQVVIPDDGSEPYFLYTDHAYYNPNSTDPGEVPDPVKSVLANLIQSLGGGLEGYPEQIKGDVIKTFTVPVSELPSNLQTAIQSEIDYQNIVKTQKNNQTQSDIKYTNDVEKFFDIGQPEINNTPPPTPTPDSTPPPSKSSVPRLYQNRSAAWMGGSIQAAATTIKNGEGFLKDQFRGTDVSVPKLMSLGKELARLNKTIGSGRGSVEQLQRLIDLRNNTQERIKAEIEGGRPDLTPVTQVPSSSDNQAELEKNIEASLKQLEIDNEELKGQSLKRNIGFAVDLGLDILTVVTLLSPIPGDEAAVIAAQAARAGVKTGAKTVAQQQTIDAFRREVTSMKTLTRAQQAINRAGSKFSKDVAIPIKVQGKTINVNANKILRNKGFKVDSYQPQGEILSESRKRILREIKQPYTMKETPKQKYKMNFKGKFTAQNTPDVTASKKSDEVVTAKNAAGQTWRTQDKYWSGYESTERMNVIYDHVGHGQIYWDTIVNENRHKKNMRDREIQEHLNLIEHKKAMKEIVEQQTLDAPKDPLFKKVAKRLKTEIDYPDKPSKNGYPDTPPPEMVNGFHPKYGKTYKYDKLDPHSAAAMPPTGNPEIDANVQKAKRLKKILGKKG